MEKKPKSLPKRVEVIKKESDKPKRKSTRKLMDEILKVLKELKYPIDIKTLSDLTGSNRASIRHAIAVLDLLDEVFCYRNGRQFYVSKKFRKRKKQVIKLRDRDIIKDSTDPMFRRVKHVVVKPSNKELNKIKIKEVNYDG